MFDRRILVGIATAVAGAIAFLWLTEIPLGVPGEWIWKRIDYSDMPPAVILLGRISALVVGAVYIVVAWAGNRRIERCSQLEAAAWLAGLVVCGFFWLSAVQDSPPAGYGLSKTVRVLYYPGSSGYFYRARYEMGDVKTFLADYETMMAEGDVLHEGTHPPGLFLFHHGLIDLCEHSELLTRFLLVTQPQSVVDGFDTLEKLNRASPRPLVQTDRAALWLAAIITQLFGVMTLVVLYLLVRRHYDRSTSWMTAAFWPLVPAMAVFLPKSDALYPFPGMLFLYLWLEGRRRRSGLMCLLSGLIFWLGAFCSLAVVPFALLATVISVWEARLCDDPRRPANWLSTSGVSAAWSLGGFVAACVVFWQVYDVNLSNVWVWNYRNHGAFYDQYQRTYWKWLLVNPMELAFAVGWPIVLVTLLSIVKAVGRTETRTQPGMGAVWGCLPVGALLWLSGKNMGEAARLWIVIQPWLVWMAAAAFAPSSHKDMAGKRIRPNQAWLIVLILQLLTCLAVVTRVNGFSV